MHTLKLSFQELQVGLATPGRDSPPPGAQLKTTAWGAAGDIQLLGSRERRTPPGAGAGAGGGVPGGRGTAEGVETANRPGPEYCSFLI